MAALKDHRQISKELDFFSFHDVAPGAVFWHPKGWIIYRTLQEFIREKLSPQGYQEISTPVMVKSQLFKQSGHWEHFGENIFSLEIDKEIYALKPMNCPESTLVYSSRTRSYNDLPIRLSDYGILHRRELSGVLGGLFRVKQFVIDDAHIYVRPDQIQEEIHKLIKLVEEFYASLNFTPHFYMATKPDKAMGDAMLWKEAEKDLQITLKDAKVKYDIKPKDGAFYGPKIDIHIKDSQNRDWQLATIQLDFQIPERMKLTYIDKDGLSKRPVMIHRAIFGSFERFIGILIEHFQGTFPVWLSPVQVVLIPIAERHVEYTKSIQKELLAHNIKVELDSRNETMQSKVRDATLQKAPYMVIIGDREMQSVKRKTQNNDELVISVRTREGKDLGQMSVPQFLEKLKDEIGQKK